MLEMFLNWCYATSEEAMNIINEDTVACLSLCAKRLGVSGQLNAACFHHRL